MLWNSALGQVHVARVIIGRDHVKITSVLYELYIPNQWHTHKVSPELYLLYAPAARLKMLRSICNLSDMNEWMKWAMGAVSICYTCRKIMILYLQRYETGLYLIGCNWIESMARVQVWTYEGRLSMHMSRSVCVEIHKLCLGLGRDSRRGGGQMFWCREWFAQAGTDNLHINVHCWDCSMKLLILGHHLCLGTGGFNSLRRTDRCSQYDRPSTCGI